MLRVPKSKQKPNKHSKDDDTFNKEDMFHNAILARATKTEEDSDEDYPLRSQSVCNLSANLNKINGA